MTVQGNFISVAYNANENPTLIQLPDGYSYEQIRIIISNNISYLIPYLQLKNDDILIFPPIDSKSPCTIQPIKKDDSKPAEIKILIEKFGQIPDKHYFDAPFTPILVTGDDGKEYNMIPSDQFK